ncbi:hypothetical protein O6H91_10G105500 [Diphasiastrum complanatum]|uniref:Uncharacterized protein n=2 Tax=Diphasiastrum complanatum TaxID=34168 RepID=A0ACC2CK91_DIPCM|nr:hypothetical protein O6H91_10G105500 [Diphasiastrum complanatum]
MERLVFIFTLLLMFLFVIVAIQTEVRLEAAPLLEGAASSFVLEEASSSFAGVHLNNEEVDGVIQDQRHDWNVDDVRLFEVNEKDWEDEPLQLIRPSKGHDRLELNELVLEKLSAITEPVSFVAVVGPYHSGKSFLLNVLLNSSHGFLVGATPEPETKGIWMRILPKGSVRTVDGCRVVLLDTEGFYGEGVSRSYDARIFAVATLLSSHLVYNTLRTLGDAQSVGALADLSKQAQVFNMQNWLHSAEGSYDTQSSLDLEVNPFLLLKTLDFPPLTWVVQGFDLDLQPAYNPMDYLQKYLLALAHTGDRTLDMLFTQGIRCYTLRTPADLNALRLQYGGQGLAADKELYSDLHPSYLSDLERLRQGVLGNLTAKGDGNLTGRNLARLIPLLVHYLNEDFPLNADRKLRDVVMDIMVDGAFSGGVQYFQLCMQSLSKGSVLPSAKGRDTFGHRDANKPEFSNIQGKLSGLVASALTSEQLERVIASAESKAIEYCRRRCVGVPQGLVTPTCEGQLGVKLARMKPYYREENDRRVKEVLVLLSEGLRNTAEKAIANLQLPMREADLQNHCTKAIKDALQGYETLVGPHRGSRLYGEAKGQMQEYIQQKCDKILHMNIDRISAILNNAKGAYRATYETSMEATGIRISDAHNGREQDSKEGSYISQGVKPISPKKLGEIHSASVRAAQAALEKEVKAEGLAWVGPGYELYDFHQFQCLQWSKQRFTDIQAQNEAHVKSFCQQLASALACRYKEEITHFTPFPDNDETITDKANTLGKQLIEEYATMVKDFLTSTGDENRRELSTNIEEARAYLLKKNTALMAAFCYDPLMDAYKELHMQDCERTFHNIWVSWSFWSFKCLWPGPHYTYGFKYVAYSAARKHLDKAQSGTSSKLAVSNHDVAKGVVLSPATRNKVIQAWIEHDLAHHANLVLVNCSFVSACTVVLLTIYFILRSKHRNAGSNSQSGKYMNAEWSSFNGPVNYSHLR